MQPIVGVISDSCKSKWGRRRPFLVGGSIIVVWSLLAIGWTRELTKLFTNSEEGDTVCKFCKNRMKIVLILKLVQNCIDHHCSCFGLYTGFQC
jgi:solute carrier family 45 protein 1/2/4